MKEYKVIKGQSKAEFEKAVNKAMNEGFILVGGLSVVGIRKEETLNPVFYQAVAK